MIKNNYEIKLKTFTDTNKNLIYFKIIYIYKNNCRSSCNILCTSYAMRLCRASKVFMLISVLLKTNYVNVLGKISDFEWNIDDALNNNVS